MLNTPVPIEAGHAPGHLRDAFAAWSEDGATAEKWPVGYAEEEWPITSLFEALWNCTDTMPRGLCDELDVALGSSYAQGVRSVSARFIR